MMTIKQVLCLHLFTPKPLPPKAIHISKKLAIRQTKKDFSEFSFSTRYRLCINEPYCCKSNNSYFSSFLPLKQQRIIAKILRCIPKKASLFLLLSSLILNKKPT